jgi:RNA polymerase sigma-70 factor (ECF subfamily)
MMPDVEAAATIEPWNDVRELVRRCQQGDLCAFTVLFERFQDRVYDLASTILEDQAEAEDAVQDTFLRVFRDIAGYRHKSSFETWLVAVVVNVCRDRLRRRKVRQALSLDWLGARWLARALGHGEDPAELVQHEEHRRSLWDTVGHLDERYRLPLILRYHYGLSCGEVADVLGLATGTVYVRLSEGRRRLRQMLLERGQADRSGKRRKG